MPAQVPAVSQGDLGGTGKFEAGSTAQRGFALPHHWGGGLAKHAAGASEGEGKLRGQKWENLWADEGFPRFKASQDRPRAGGANTGAQLAAEGWSPLWAMR